MYLRYRQHTLIKRSKDSPSSRRLRDRALGGSDNEGRRLMVTDKEFHDRNVVLKPLEQPEGKNITFKIYKMKLDMEHKGTK